MSIAKLFEESEALANVVDCNICGSSNYDVIFPAGKAQKNQIVACKNCGLMYASPRAQLVDSKDYERYEAEGLVLGVNDDRDHPYRWRFDKELFQCQDYQEVRDFLGSLNPERGNLLEIGCSLGQTLDFFRQAGWNVQGVEPWKEAALFTSEQMNISCSPTTLEDASLKANFFDVILMFHVIEHVDHPLDTLREVFRVLKPGGFLVLETPRYDTLMYALLRNRERSLSCDGHIYFFTTKSLQDLYEKSGFKLIRLEYNGRSLSLSRFLWNLSVISKNKKLQEFTEKTTYRLGLDQLRFYLNLRDMQRVILQKPNPEQ